MRGFFEIFEINSSRASTRNNDDRNWTLNYSNDSMLAYYTKLWWVLLTNYEQTPDTPECILETFENQVKTNPDKLHLFHLWAHGWEDGSVALAWWNRTKVDFDRLFNIAAQFPHNVKIDISSCLSSFKWHGKEDAIKNVSLDSGKQSSLGGEDGHESIFLQAFDRPDEADFDGDKTVNFNEALLYRAIHYNYSLTPIMMDDGKGKAIDIAMGEWNEDETQTG